MKVSLLHLVLDQCYIAELRKRESFCLNPKSASISKVHPSIPALHLLNSAGYLIRAFKMSFMCQFGITMTMKRKVQKIFLSTRCHIHIFSLLFNSPHIALDTHYSRNHIVRFPNPLARPKASGRATRQN